MDANQPTFTAAQIALVLGKTPNTIRHQLRGIALAGIKIAGGNQAAAWRFEQLPAILRARIEDAARRQNYRNAVAMLTAPRERWHPAISLSEICDGDIQGATKLREALLPWLVQQHDTDCTSAEMEERGVQDYRRVFGNTITARYWRELFMRTIERDNDFQEWSRLEIYLPNSPKSKMLAKGRSLKNIRDEFRELSSYLAACGDPLLPSEIELRAIWTMAFEKYSVLVGQGRPEKKAARLVRDFLFSTCPFLSRSRNSLRMAFERKLARWNESKGNAKSLLDGREENGDRFELPENDRDALIHRAVFYYRGDIAPAWRDLLRKGFSADVISRYAGRAGDKSHVPHRVRESVGPEVEILTVMHRGRRAFDSIKGHVTRCYDGISSLQCISGDDFTLNTYFYVPDGKGWFQLTRGQVIFFIDFRSSRILGWALEPRRQYSSLTIRSLCTHVFGAYGVPQILYFERGLWKSASLLKGKMDPFDFTEISQGLREFGIKFIHAVRPRTKTIERIGGMFQDIAEAEPGYCGRDERRDAPESLRREMAEVQTHKSHPSKFFYSLDQWNRRIEQLVDQYNSEIQQGHILAGMSPDQAFEKHMDANDPPLQFAAALRYLLAHDKRRARVTLNGVTIQIGKQKFNYRGSETSHLVGREVLVWFDPENTESIVVTNLDRTNPICVRRSENPNALESVIEPDAGTLGRELARIEDQASHMKTRFNVVKAKFAMPTRILLGAAHAQLGEQISGRKTEIAEAENRRSQQRGRAQRFAQRTGIAVPERAAENLQPDDARFLSEFLDGKEMP
jgi:Mu transposase, C-terminal